MPVCALLDLLRLCRLMSGVEELAAEGDATVGAEQDTEDATDGTATPSVTLLMTLLLSIDKTISFFKY